MHIWKSVLLCVPLKVLTHWSRYAAEDAEPAKGIKVEKLEGWKGRKPPVIRCTTTIPASVPRPLWIALMDDLALRQVWDDACALTHRVATFEGDELANERSINHTQTKPVLGGLVSPREFLSFGVERALESGNTFINVSVPVEHLDYPECAPYLPGCQCSPIAPCSVLNCDEAVTRRTFVHRGKHAIRGQVLFFSLTWDRPSADADWTVEYIVQVELNGWLPRGPITSGTIQNIRDFLRYISAVETDWESIRHTWNALIQTDAYTNVLQINST